MVFVVIGQGEAGIVSVTCGSTRAALEAARRLTDEGVVGVLIDAGGQEYAASEFERLFIEPSALDAEAPA